jgi:hypothetical protein
MCSYTGEGVVVWVIVGFNVRTDLGLDELGGTGTFGVKFCLGITFCAASRFAITSLLSLIPLHHHNSISTLSLGFPIYPLFDTRTFPSRCPMFVVMFCVYSLLPIYMIPILP